MTITFVSEKYPLKLIRHMTEIHQYKIKKMEAGIYQVYGDLIPIQIIVTKNLSEQKNLWLKSLTNKLSEPKKAEKLVAEYLKHSKNDLYRCVLETIIRANPKTFVEVNEMDDIIMEIVQEKFDKRLKEAVEKQVEERTKEIKKNMAESITAQVTEKTRLMDSILLIQKKCRKDKSLSVIADEMEAEPEKIRFIYDLVCNHTEQTAEELYELATGLKA